MAMCLRVPAFVISTRYHERSPKNRYYMKVYKTLTTLHHMPLDWKLLWGDSCNLLHPVLGVYYNEDAHKTFVTLFRDGYLEAHKNELSVKDFANMLLKLPLNSFDSELVFNNFHETDYCNAGMFEYTSEILNIKGFRKAKYTEYDFNSSQNRKRHYVRMMLFNDDLDRKG